jgi:putative ABC transport system permease protein
VIPFNKNIGKHYAAFEYDVAALNLFDYISASRYPLYGSFDTYFAPSINNEEQVSLAVLFVDESFIGMMGLKWSIPPTDSFYLSEKNTAILNQTAANLLNLGAEPIGQSIQLGRRQLVVRGILNDFNYESLKNKIGPLCLSISSHTDTLSVWSSDGGYMYGTLKKGKNVSDAVKQLNKVYNKYDIENVFEYSFTDDSFSNLYENENRLEKLTYVSISITLLIACFSLYGLAMFLIQQRYGCQSRQYLFDSFYRFS